MLTGLMTVHATPSPPAHVVYPPRIGMGLSGLVMVQRKDILNMNSTSTLLSPIYESLNMTQVCRA